MTIISFTNKALALGTILAQAFIFLSIIYFVFFRKKQYVISQFLGKNGMFFAFIIALISTVASLFYSEVVGFAPCDLCWYQRVFMYPLVILLGLALIKKDFKIIDYALSLSLIGFLISLYQNYIYYFNNGLDARCLLAGKGISCIKRYVFEFGYVSIPIMALTAFSLIIVFFLFQKLYNRPAD